MRTPRWVAFVVVMAALLTSCGRGDDPDADRIVSSPSATTSSSPDVSSASPGPSATSAGAAAATGAAATNAPVRRDPAPTAAPNLAAARVKLTKVVSISDPVAMALRPGDSAFYIAQRHLGTIRPIRDGKVGSPILDIRSQISTGNEQGLLGLAFSSDGKKLYVYFTEKPGGAGTGPAGTDVLREYTLSSGRATSPRDLLRVADPEGNHNGGDVRFGPDGYLYVALGDGGGAGDRHGPSGNGQNLNALLGKILRIDPKPSGGAAYTIPDDNPFVGKDGRDEIWAYGLRNPWRFSFDRSTGDMWIGDVGQNQWEEVNFDAKGSGGGDNYGWRRMEGTHSYNGGTAPPSHHAPIYEYSHDQGCSITGGYVYRGTKIHHLKGAYVFADFCEGALRAFVQDGGRATGHRFLGPKVGQIASFGQSKSGELYVLTLSNALYRLDRA